MSIRWVSVTICAQAPVRVRCLDTPSPLSLPATLDKHRVMAGGHLSLAPPSSRAPRTSPPQVDRRALACPGEVQGCHCSAHAGRASPGVLRTSTEPLAPIPTRSAHSGFWGRGYLLPLAARPRNPVTKGVQGCWPKKISATISRAPCHCPLNVHSATVMKVLKKRQAKPNSRD